MTDSIQTQLDEIFHGVFHNLTRRDFLRMFVPDVFKRKRTTDPIRLLDAMLYVVKTGCQWDKLCPQTFPKWRTVYNHFRSWGDRGWFTQLMRALVCYRRMQLGRNALPSMGVIDSESVRWGVPDSVKGIDGHKRVKGIKRHIMVDSNGLPMGVAATTANTSDQKGAIGLIAKTVTHCESITLIKADKGYRGALEANLPQMFGIELQCVKSNHGTSGFIPMSGRWVVERCLKCHVTWLSLPAAPLC